MKNPDKIKKGLERCANSGMCYCPGMCDKCPYDAQGDKCIRTLGAEALTYIQQLEAERDAAIADIRLAYESYVGRCETCKHVERQVDCDEPEGCGLCRVEDCLCRSCGEDDCNWEWRGVQKEVT